MFIEVSKRLKIHETLQDFQVPLDPLTLCEGLLETYRKHAGFKKVSCFNVSQFRMHAG
jgi:hypothetical protein